MHHGNLFRRITVSEAVTLAALRDSRRDLIGLEQMKKELKAAIEREQKQFDCLQFFDTMAQSEAAYGWCRCITAL